MTLDLETKDGVFPTRPPQAEDKARLVGRN